MPRPLRAPDFAHLIYANDGEQLIVARPHVGPKGWPNQNDYDNRVNSERVSDSIAMQALPKICQSIDQLHAAAMGYNTK
jgi:hypothetical protein